MVATMTAILSEPTAHGEQATSQQQAQARAIRQPAQIQQDQAATTIGAAQTSRAQGQREPSALQGRAQDKRSQAASLQPTRAQA
ncbi:hypothetical protein ACFX2H_013328 [Malus domestica]